MTTLAPDDALMAQVARVQLHDWLTATQQAVTLSLADFAHALQMEAGEFKNLDSVVDALIGRPDRTACLSGYLLGRAQILALAADVLGRAANGTLGLTAQSEPAPFTFPAPASDASH